MLDRCYIHIKVCSLVGRAGSLFVRETIMQAPRMGQVPRLQSRCDFRNAHRLALPTHRLNTYDVSKAI